MRLYLDACSIIYLIEGQPRFQERVAARIEELGRGTGSHILTSRLSRLECRTRPVREKDLELLSAYETFFSLHDVAVVEIDATVIERATDLRARYGLRTPDAIHVATAVEQQVDLFLTGDVALARCPEVTVEILAE